MSGKILLISVIVFSCFLTASAMQCYRCWDDCPSADVPDSKHLVDCSKFDPGNLGVVGCFYMKSYTTDGSKPTKFGRSCAFGGRWQMPMNTCKEVVNGKVGVQVCLCDGDACNQDAATAGKSGTK